MDRRGGGLTPAGLMVYTALFFTHFVGGLKKKKMRLSTLYHHYCVFVTGSSVLSVVPIDLSTLNYVNCTIIKCLFLFMFLFFVQRTGCYVYCALFFFVKCCLCPKTKKKYCSGVRIAITNRLGWRTTTTMTTPLFLSERPLAIALQGRVSMA